MPFHRKGTDRDELQVRARFCQRLETVIAGRVKCDNHCGGGNVLDCCCMGDERDLLFVQCRKWIVHERWMFKLLVWMCELADDLFDRPHLDYFVKLQWLDDTWFDKSYKY